MNIKEKQRLVKYNELKKEAKRRGFDVISKEIASFLENITLVHKKCGTELPVLPTNFLASKGTGCRYCSGKLTPEERTEQIVTLLKSLNLKLCSVVPKRTEGTILIRCPLHGKRKTTVRTVLSGSGCRTCSFASTGLKNRNEVETIRKKLKDAGFAWIAGEYNGQYSRLTLKCSAKKHEVKLVPKRIFQGQKCTECLDQDFESKLDEKYEKELERYRRLGKKRGWTLLSKIYRGKLLPLKFRCKCTRVWAPIPVSIDRGSGCPDCASGLGERLVRVAFEQIFRAKFPNETHEWLKWKETGNLLSLDGYNSKLQLAFEHQGRQHTKKQKYYQNSNAKFQDQLRRDAFKRNKCKKRGIALVEIHELGSITRFEDFKDALKRELIRLKFPIPKNFESIRIDWDSGYSSMSIEWLRRIHEEAKLRNGECLSKSYIGMHGKLRFRCSGNHLFPLSPAKLFAKQWCRQCGIKNRGKKKRIPEQWFIDYVENKNGKYISSSRENGVSWVEYICQHSEPVIFVREVGVSHVPL